MENEIPFRKGGESEVSFVVIQDMTRANYYSLEERNEFEGPKTPGWHWLFQWTRAVRHYDARNRF